MALPDSQYEGGELDLFAGADNWKSYVSEMISPHLKGRVLEVGAGKGDTTKVLTDDSPPANKWICLEPDRSFTGEIRRKITRGELPSFCQTIRGTLECVSDQPRFDTILYMDVLEHIEDDQLECEKATELLTSAGTLIILAPAHSWLYSEFDRSINHYRRYDRDSLQSVVPDDLTLKRLFHLDCGGLLLSMMNRWFLHQSLPTRSQIQFWDRYVVPFSRVIDSVVRYSAGKSIVGVWQK